MHLQVSTNGVLSFRDSFLDFVPESFPIPTNVLIAPFWDDSDNTLGGQVFYRFTDNQEILDVISTRINGAFPVNFNPLTAFIVTWYQLPQFQGVPTTVVSKLLL